MFSRSDLNHFILGGTLVTIGFLLIAIDPSPYGFGPLTLWVAPPLLLAGFVFPALGIIGVKKFQLAVSLKSPRIVAGLATFLAALVVYTITLEPTASLWDCSEFIPSAYKLQVPHTPGTPLSLLVGRLFTMMSFGNVESVARSLNFMSGLFSALTVLLVYHIIYHLGLSIIHDHRFSKAILTLSSMGGSLCLAFSDSFWFSAVEAETYGLACFFLILLLWLIFTGRNLTGTNKSRRLILIFYVAGLAYCIHPMCLLAIPTLPLTWGLARRKLSIRTTVFLSVAGLAIVFLINRFIAIESFEIAFTFDRFFVNNMGLPFYSGTLALGIAITLCFISIVRRYIKLAPYLWSVLFLVIGFMPYLLLFIRSNHNPPIDETNPENLPLIKAYMNRESYPSAPLLFGPYFDARIVNVDVRKKIYFKADAEYKLAGTLPEYVYDSRQTFLPRMYSNDLNHIQTYRRWTGLSDSEKPNFFHNLKFMVTYQLGHMYFRYLMWNFAGREGDQQNSRWLRPWERISQSSFERARNQYWMIPLLLGIVGAIFHFRRDRRTFIPVAMLFLITGAVLALYLNAPPNEPRERDYIYVGSFIAFSIWLGLGFLAIGILLTRYRFGIWAAGLLSLSVPCWMLSQNFDDHNRSGRTFQADNARNILNSCAPGSILFTGGDNDTFPLWYLQEVEGFRTDVRVMVLSYMNTDWYINQLRRTYYDSGAFKLTLDEDDYRQYGANDVLYVHESIDKAVDVSQYLQLLKREHHALTMLDRNGEPYHIVPSRRLEVNVMGARPVSGRGSLSSHDAQEAMTLHITDNYLSKSQLAILDLIVSNQWQRPIYFNFTSLNTLGIDLSSYVVQEGAIYRLRPEKNQSDDVAVDTSLTYRNIVERGDYDNLNDPDVYFSYEDHFARMVVPVRHSFNDLARAFLKEDNAEMALHVLQKALNDLYPAHLPPSYTGLEAAEMLIALDERDKAKIVTKPLFNFYFPRLQEARERGHALTELDLYLVRRSAELLAEAGDKSYLDKLNKPGK